LLIHGEHVEAVPTFDDLAVFDPDDGDAQKSTGWAVGAPPKAAPECWPLRQPPRGATDRDKDFLRFRQNGRRLERRHVNPSGECVSRRRTLRPPALGLPAERAGVGITCP
jgi:hypothetical protein